MRMHRQEWPADQPPEMRFTGRVHQKSYIYAGRGDACLLSVCFYAIDAASRHRGPHATRLASMTRCRGASTPSTRPSDSYASRVDGVFMRPRRRDVVDAAVVIARERHPARHHRDTPTQAASRRTTRSPRRGATCGRTSNRRSGSGTGSSL